MGYEFKNVTVLIIESTRAMFDLTKSVLTTFGIGQIYAAYGFDAGFKAYCRINPDLVVMDWLEEPNNGLELTKKIRTDPNSPNPFVPIILMSGYSLKKRVLMARDSGITEFLVKPYTAKALYQRIEQLIERPRQFVKSNNYFGPDRRRVRDSEYTAPNRRSDESAVQVPVVEKTVARPSAVQISREIKERMEANKNKDKT